jgi:hypothetical protein
LVVFWAKFIGNFGLILGQILWANYRRLRVLGRSPGMFFDREAVAVVGGFLFLVRSLGATPLGLSLLLLQSLSLLRSPGNSDKSRSAKMFWS